MHASSLAGDEAQWDNQQMNESVTENTSSHQEVIYRGKPLLFPYMVRSIGFVVAGIGLLYFLYLIVEPSLYVVLSPFLGLALWLIIGMPLRTYFLFLNLDYVVSSDKIEITSGIFNKKIISIPYSEIYQVDSFENAFERISNKNAGTIFIYAALLNKPFTTFGGNFVNLSPVDGRGEVKGYYLLRSLPQYKNVHEIIENAWTKNRTP
jgi:membrane protein YdbS with pleckstrin-like domain